MSDSLNRSRERYAQAFFLAFAVAAAIFLPFLIFDKGVFLYYGDYNVQQIPFSMLAHDAVRSGEIFWNWNTDLGANFIGSYSFYMLGSPFFYLMLPFPTSFVPYLLPWVLMLKIATASLTGYAFIRRFVRSSQAALIGGLLYAFSGFSAYNIFFNHFHDVLAFFPLLLIGLEELVVNERKGMFALSVALCATVNYFFFVGEVVFVILYFILRCFSPDFTINARKFFCIALEAVIGLALSAFLLLPSVLAVMDNPRVDDPLYGFNLLFYSSVQRYGLILQSFFFPPDIPSRPNFFPDSNAKWASVAGFLPLFSMSGVIAFMQAKRRHWAKRLIILSAVMAFIPGLNSLFYLGNSSYYARWFYMPVLIMAFMTAYALDSMDTDEGGALNIGYGLKWCAAIVAGFALIGVLPTKDKEDVIVFGQMPASQLKFWINVAIAALCLLLTLYLLFDRNMHRRFLRRSMIGVCIASVVCTLSMMIPGRAIGYNYDRMVTMGVYGGEKLQLPSEEGEFYRIDVLDGVDNYPMYWGIPSIQAFHSVVPASIMEFYPSIGVTRDVASRPEITFYGLRGLTSVKYLLYPTYNEDDPPEVPGFTYLTTQNECRIYENEAFVPMGYTYDHFITADTFEKFAEKKRDRLLLRAVLLDEFQLLRYADLFTPLPEDRVSDTSDKAYLADCEDRASETADTFVTDRDGFTATSSLSRENLMVFSVPYEAGWSAMVNGEEARVEKVNNGFMAVRVPAGEATIRFQYRTPGLFLGIAITVGAIVVLVLYLLLWKAIERKHPHLRTRPGAHLRLLTLMPSVRASSAYAEQTAARIREQPIRMRASRPDGEDAQWEEADSVDIDWPELPSDKDDTFPDETDPQ